jgi:hypothetical protein
MTEKFLVPKTDVTYGQLDKVLKSFGFKRSVFETHAKGVYYEHKETGASIKLPLFPKDDYVLDYHMIMVRGTLDDFGVANPTVFDAKLQKAG